MKTTHDSPSLTTGQRLSLVVAAVCAAGAVLLALLPIDWIEEVFGVEPDGGNGLFELAPIIVLAVAAVAHRAGGASPPEEQHLDRRRHLGRRLVTPSPG